MQETQRLRHEIMAVVNLPPLEGLRLLAEFVQFLRDKFRLTVLSAQPSDMPPPNHDEVWQNITVVRPADNGNIRRIF